MRHQIGNIHFNELSFSSAMQRVSDIIQRGTYCHQIVIANVHSLILSKKNSVFANICRQADLIFADGMPIVWASRLLGGRIPERIAGPDFMWGFSEVSAQRGYKVFLLGGTENALNLLNLNLRKAFPGLQIVGSYSPPYGTWSQEENVKIVNMINFSDAQLLWLGVSTPKQDIWIAQNKEKLKVKVAIGVGAAFDFHSGRVKRAPLWLQKIGMEWFFRFLQDPKRLWKRYLVSNCLFVILIVQEFLEKTLKRKKL